MNERKIGIFLSYLTILLHAVIGFAYVPILLHYIGKSEYGLYQLIGSLIAYFSIMDFGLTNAIVRFYAGYRALSDERGMENLLAGSLRLYGGATVFALAVGGVCYGFLDAAFAGSMTEAELSSAKAIFLLLLFNVAATLMTMIFRAVIMASERFLFLKGTELLQLVLQPVLVVLILQGYSSAFSVALAQTVMNVILIAARVYYCFARLHIRIRFHGWDRGLLADFRKLALSLFAVGVIDQVFFRTNQVILGAVSGTEAVAVYSVAALIYMNYMALSTAISGVYLPHVSELVAKKASSEALSALFIQIGRWQYHLLALVATGFILFGGDFIRLWAGEDFEDAYWMTLLIILPLTVDLIQNIGLSVMQALNCYSFRAKVYFAMGVFNLALAIPMGSAYGGIGCAAVTGLSMFLGNGLIMNWYYARRVGLAIGRFWHEIGGMSVPILACLAAGFVGNFFVLTTGIGVFLAKIVSYAAFYGAATYLFGMNAAEQSAVRRIVRKIMR